MPFDVPRSMDYGEAWLLTQRLVTDPTSHVAAAVNGWEHTWSWEAATLADVYDLLAQANTDKRHRARLKPYPRPVPSDGTKKYRPKVSQKQVHAALAARGH